MQPRAVGLIPHYVGVGRGAKPRAVQASRVSREVNMFPQERWGRRDQAGSLPLAVVDAR